MQEHSINLAPFLSLALQNIHPIVFQWCSKEQITLSLEKHLHQNIQQRMFTPEWAEKYAKACPTPDSLASDYSLRLIDGGSNGKTLAGIHFYGGDTTKPFIGILGRDWTIDSPKLLSYWKNRLFEEFESFYPQSLQLFQASETTELCLPALPNVQIDQYLIAGSISEIKEQPRPELKGVSLHPLPYISNDEYLHFREAFERFYEEKPIFKDRVFPASFTELQACGTVGGLFEVRINDQWAGIIAAQPSTHPPLTGYIVWEEFLDTPFRGTKRSHIMQRLLIENLPPIPSDIILGTIDFRNKASLGTALKTGRMIIGAEMFVF